MVFILITLIAVFISSIACDTPPSFDENLLTNVIVEAGQSARLECRANGSPTPKIEWQILRNFGDPERYFPNGDIIYPGGVLKFESVSQEQVGYYYCIAKNGVGTPIQQRFYLDIKQAPKILRTTRSEDIGVKITLSCYAKGNPITEIVWYKNNEKLINVDKYEIETSSWSDDTLWSGISISTMDKDFHGIYKCKIENNGGKAEKYFKILPSHEG